MLWEKRQKSIYVAWDLLWNRKDDTMKDVLVRLTEPQNVIWIIIIAILLIGKLGFGLDYISVIDILKNHLKCFRNEKGRIMIVPVINYIILPFVMGIATALTKEINSETIDIITIIISILTAMLFTVLTIIIDMRAKINKNPLYYSMEAQVSKKSLIETYYTVMYEILVSIILLILCFFNCFTHVFGFAQSFLIYSLTYMLIINLFMIVKRIFRVIDTDMNK